MEEGNKYFILKGEWRQNLRRWNPGHEYLWEFVLAALESGVSQRWRGLTTYFEVLTLVPLRKIKRKKSFLCLAFQIRNMQMKKFSPW